MINSLVNVNIYSRIFIASIQGSPIKYSQLYQILTDSHNSFTDTYDSKFAIKLSLKIPPHLKRVATLPCEILMSTFEYRAKTARTILC